MNIPTAREINQPRECGCGDSDCEWTYLRVCEWGAPGCVVTFRADEHPDWQGWIGDTETWVCGPCRAGVYGEARP